jgi:hypothetical protein
MNLSFLTVFIDSGKVASYTRAFAAAGLTWLLTKYPALNPFIDQTMRDAFATGAATLAVGIWSHIAKSIAPPVGPLNVPLKS